MNFRVGQKVVAARESRYSKSSFRYPGESCLTKNKVYTIRGIVDWGSEGIGLYLEEVVNPKVWTTHGYKERSYGADGFSPVIEKTVYVTVDAEVRKLQKELRDN